MLQGFKDLLNSEHGLFGIVIMIAATVLVALGRMTVDQWTGFAQVIFVAYGGAHVGVSIADAIASKGTSSAAPAEPIK